MQQKAKALAERRNKQAEMTKTREERLEKEKETAQNCHLKMTEGWLVGIGQVLNQASKYKAKASSLIVESNVWQEKFAKHETSLLRLRAALEKKKTSAQSNMASLRQTLEEGKAEVNCVSMNMQSLDALISVQN